MTSFSELLNQDVGAVEKPKPFPIGTYLWQIASHKIEEVGQNKQPKIDINCLCLAAESDVDATELEEAKGITRPDGNPKSSKKTFWLTEDSLWRFTAFLKDTLGITGGKSIMRVIEEDLASKKFLGTITHRKSKDGEDTFAEIGDTAAVE